MKKPIITIVPREKPAPVEPKYKWLLPSIVVVAVVVIVVVVIIAVAQGTFIG
jgi:hypothetical protein